VPTAPIGHKLCVRVISILWLPLRMRWLGSTLAAQLSAGVAARAGAAGGRCLQEERVKV
jgi:hypothetical protein